MIRITVKNAAVWDDEGLTLVDRTSEVTIPDHTSWSVALEAFVRVLFAEGCYIADNVDDVVEAVLHAAREASGANQ